MSTVSDLVAAGFPGYAGWNDAAAAADFAATKGAGKGNGRGGGVPGQFQAVQAPDIQAIQDKVFNQLKPYYLQLLKESNGDLQRATDALKQDYAKGTRQALEDYNRQTGYGLQDLQNSLDSLGISFNSEQEQKVDELNKRGMASYEGGAVGVQPLNPGSYNPAGATRGGVPAGSVDNSGMGAYTPTMNMANTGRGGYELDQMRKNQALRQEALQRSANQKLQGFGIDYTRYTNPNATDPSMRGTAENTLNRGIDSETRAAQQRAENLYQQLGQNTMNLAQGFAASGVDASKANVSNLYQKDQQQTFINSGI